MEVKLESLLDIGFQNGYSIEHLSKGDVIEAKFSEYGVKLKFRNVWSLCTFDYQKIKKHFKVYGQ